MNNLKNIYAALDIGSGYIKGVVAEVYDGDFFILASSKVRSDGFGAGAIINEELLVERIKEVVTDLERKVGIAVKDFVIGIGVYSVQITKLYGETFVTNSEGRIKSDDMQRVLINACEKYESEDSEIINIIPTRYNVDGYESDIALGLDASKFGMEVLALTAPNEKVYPYLSAVEKAGINVLDICLLPFAEQFEIKAQKENVDSLIVVNVGFTTTSISILNKGVLKGIGSYNLGIKRLLFECSKDLKVTQDSLLEHIETFGLSYNFEKTEKKVFDSIDGGVVEFTIEEINNYFIHLVSSLLITIKKEVDKYSEEGDFETVFIGGSLEIEGFEELLQKTFNYDVEVCKPKYLGARDTAYVSSFGLVRYIVDKMKDRGRLGSSLTYDEQLKLTTPKKKILNISDDSIIGKLFEYFFE